MPRKRQARKCRAHRTDGEPCGNYAIRGGYVCRMHGGAAWHVREKANRRLLMADLYRQMRADDAMHERDVMRWRVEQIVTTASLLGIGIEDVDLAAIRRCYVLYGGEPFSLQGPPRRHDRRYGPRKRAA